MTSRTFKCVAIAGWIVICLGLAVMFLSFCQGCSGGYINQELHRTDTGEVYQGENTDGGTYQTDRHVEVRRTTPSSGRIRITLIDGKYVITPE